MATVTNTVALTIPQYDMTVVTNAVALNISQYEIGIFTNTDHVQLCLTFGI